MGGRTAAVRRRPSATDLGISNGPLRQARKATPAAHQGANLTEEAEPPKENVDPKRFSCLECEPLPLPHLREGRGAVPSRGDVIEANIADASGWAAGKVMLEALEVEPAQEAGIFTRVARSGSSTRSSQTTPFRSLVWGRSGRSSRFTFARLRNLEGAKRRERLCIVGVGSCARRSRSRSRRGMSGGKRKQRQRSKTRDSRGWASHFRTDGRRKAGGPSGSGGRVGPRSTCEIGGTKKFQRAKEASVWKQRWRCDPSPRSSGTKLGKERAWRVECRGICFHCPRTGLPVQRVRRLFRPSTHGGITRKIKRGVGATRTEAPGPEMVAPSVGREGTRLQTLW